MYLEAEAAVLAGRMLLVLAVSVEQHKQLPVVLLALPGLRLVAAHRQQEGHNLVVAYHNLQVGTDRNPLVGRNLPAAVSNPQLGHSLLVGHRNLLVRWSEGARNLLEGCRRRLLGGRTLLEPVLDGGTGLCQGQLESPQGRMETPQGRMETFQGLLGTAPEDRCMVWGLLGHQGSQTLGVG